MKRPKGTYDRLPPATWQWRQVIRTLMATAGRFGYSEIVTPVFEYTELFQRGVGESTDIVEKEMYTFDDLGGRSLTLRPEMTAAVGRAYLENGLFNETLPAKLAYVGPNFRQEQPQAGRYRQFYQFGVEVIASQAPEVDVEVIDLALNAFRSLGLSDFEIRLNSIGCPDCRPGYLKRLREYYQPKRSDLCTDCQRRLERNPLRLLDCKEASCQALQAEAPLMIEHLCRSCEQHFDQVKVGLERLNISYRLDPTLVRGIDYYTKTVFEVIHKGLGAQNALIGGGRYDGLIEALGGDSTPGIGFAMGMERLMSTLDEAGSGLQDPPALDLFVLTIGDEASQRGQTLLHELRAAGISSDRDYLDRSVKSQLRYADRYPAKRVAFLGDDELEKDIVTVRNMTSGEQSEVKMDRLVTWLKGRS